MKKNYYTSLLAFSKFLWSLLTALVFLVGYKQEASVLVFKGGCF